MAEVEVQPPTKDAPSAPAQSKSEPAADLSSKKRPVQEKATEPQKKRRSVFAQETKEIDARIYGKINRDVNPVRRQDEAKRDRQNASRKEEGLAIKDEAMKFRQNCFPRLAGFLVTSDDIPPDTDENKESEPERSSPPSPDDVPGAFDPKKPLTHPPPLKQPPALYFVPTILTPAQKKFLDAQKAAVGEILAEEQKEWGATKKVGLEDVQQLRKHAEETLAPVKEKQEDNRWKDEEARKRDAEEPANASTAPVAPTADEEMEVETENPVGRGMDAEERIEY